MPKIMPQEETDVLDDDFDPDSLDDDDFGEEF